jgi:hypothetical protein
MLLSKDDCLGRARRLLASDDSAALRYACLELRLCMEAVTYEKLRAYASRLPADVLSRWQPPQAVAALLELEGGADEEYTIAIGLRRDGVTGPMEVIGEHRTFATAWLRKHYHKLGSFLHVPNVKERERRSEPIALQDLREYLEDIVRECERVMQSSITSALAPVVEFTCQLCRRKNIANGESARSRGRASCLQLGCEAEHSVSEGEHGSLYFRLAGSIFPCQECGHEQLIPAKFLTEGHEFGCEDCGRRHKLVDRVWRYAAEVRSEDAAR